MALLHVDSITKRFGGIVANDSISLSVERTEIVALIGPNGAGKSTLFDIIAGFYKPDDGEVVFAGRRVTGVPPYRISRYGVAKTFQKLRLFLDMTALENVTVAALPRATSVSQARKVAYETLTSVGLGEQAEKPAGVLSTGQRKRLEVARALATSPLLLLLDEPLAGVDPPNVRTMLELLRNLRARGLTLLIIEHNLRAVMTLADRVIAMHLGRKIADGPPAVVAEAPAVVQAYLGAAYVGSS